MSRPPRFIPENGSLVEITCRTDQGRYLLRPDPVIDDILLGVLGSMLKAVLEGEPIRGTWFNRTQEYRARLRKKKKDSEPERFPSEETVALSQLPCWRHLSPEVYRELVAGLLRTGWMKP